MNYEEWIKELISKNNRLGRKNIELIQKIKEKDETIHNQTYEINKLKNKVGELEDRLMRMYVS